MPLCTKCDEAKDASEFRQREGKLNASCKECERAYQRAWYAKNPEKGRAKAKKSMAKRRREKQGEVLNKQREYYHKKGKHREKAYYEEMKANDPWRWRARNCRRNASTEITEEWLRRAFKEQGGVCALSGRNICVRTFHVDHIVPKAAGGSDCLSNLRLVCEEANLAKSGLTDEQLISLCEDILKKQIPEIIGRAIMAL